MNNRVNELFEAALDAAVPKTCTRLLPSQLSRVKTVFAESIIRQCANICNSDDDTSRILDAFGLSP